MSLSHCYFLLISRVNFQLIKPFLPSLAPWLLISHTLLLFPWGIFESIVIYIFLPHFWTFSCNSSLPYSPTLTILLSLSFSSDNRKWCTFWTCDTVIYYQEHSIISTLTDKRVAKLMSEVQKLLSNLKAEKNSSTQEGTWSRNKLSIYSSNCGVFSSDLSYYC